MNISHIKTAPAPTRALGVALLSFILLPFVSAQQTPLADQGHGSIRGTVLSAMTTDVLEGAEITLLPSGRRANTARDGTFNFGNVPAGDAKITVSYPGLSTQEITLSISPGRVSETTVSLRDDDVVQLEAFVVQSTKEGMSKAIAVQKSADDLRAIAASDQFGDYSGNLGDYLRFLPGVAPSTDDGRDVSLRGMAPFLTNFTLDSTRVASASSGNMTRVSELETLSLSNVESIEVIKTLTPDQAAINTAGSINMVSKSAFDQTKPFSLRYRAYMHIPWSLALERAKTVGETSGKEMSMIRGNMEIDLTRKVGRDFGFYIGARAYQNAYTNQRSQWTYNFNPQFGGLPDDPTVSQWSLYNERGLITRRSASLRTDWRISPLTKWSLSASWNTFESNFHRKRLNFYWNPNVTNADPSTNRALSSTDAPVYTVSTRNIRSALNPNGSEAGYIGAQTDDQRKNSTVSAYSTAFENMLNSGGIIKLELYYSRSRNTYRSTDLGAWAEGYTRVSSVRIETDEPGALVPRLSYTRNDEPLDLDDITIYRAYNALDYSNTATDDRYGGAVSFTQKLPFERSTTIKLGALWDKTERDINRFYYTTGNPLIPENQPDAMLAVRDDIASAAPGALGFPGHPAFLDNRKLWTLYSDRLASATPNTTNYAADFYEESTALYLRVDFKPAEDWLIVAGARYEGIDGRNLNKIVAVQNPSQYPRGTFKDDSMFYSLNVKYTPSRNHVFRAAITQSMGLPNYNDLLPENRDQGVNQVTGRGFYSESNPDLKPYQVVNYDLSYSWYYSKSGNLTASLFHKSFKNYIVSITRAMTEELALALGLDPDVDLPDGIGNYDYVTKMNIADKGYYQGIELSASDRLTFLPRPFNTIGVQASLTLIDVTPIKTRRVLDPGNSAQNASFVEQVDRALVTHAMPVQASIVVDWRYRKFFILAAVTHTGRTLRAVAQQTVQYSDIPVPQYTNAETYSEKRTNVDVRAEYRWKPWLVPYIQVRNLANSKVKRTMEGQPLYTINNLGPVYEVGFRGNF